MRKLPEKRLPSWEKVAWEAGAPNREGLRGSQPPLNFGWGG